MVLLGPGIKARDSRNCLSVARTSQQPLSEGAEGVSYPAHGDKAFKRQNHLPFPWALDL